ncbi:MAG: methyltransferase domain-containing protein, partial [Chitinivibrionales bacterium]|nr:methyltransferase domain-containing protein [Chitinivibrionales bacterium]
SGEEPYSMAMTLLETCRGYDVDMRILGSDISTRMLTIAQTGVYSAKRMEPVPAGWRATYFDKAGRGDEAEWAVTEKLRKLVVLKRINLTTTPFPMRGPLDIVFCRNVMIYFDDAGRRKLLDEIFRLLKPGGFLLVGHAESLTGMVSKFRSIEPSVYVRP